VSHTHTRQRRRKRKKRKKKEEEEDERVPNGVKDAEESNRDDKRLTCEEVGQPQVKRKQRRASSAFFC